jgi:hypothetical protein
MREIRVGDKVRVAAPTSAFSDVVGVVEKVVVFVMIDGQRLSVPFYDHEIERVEEGVHGDN